MADLKENLEALSRSEREIEDLLRRKNLLPQSIAAAVAGAGEAREQIASRQRELAEAEKTRRTKEGELRDFEARRLKFQGQTALVKTNDEYAALLHQIDDASSRISGTEDEILVALETVERITSELAVVEVEQRGLEQTHLRNAEALREQLCAVEKALEGCEAERAVLAERLPQALIGRYERVRGASGYGTTFLVGRSCSRCHRDIPYETINRVRAGEGQICGNCGRLIIIVPPPDAPEP